MTTPTDSGGAVAWRILPGDCIGGLRTLPDGIAQTCVTSPPYWGLRDYGHDGQLGLERTPEEYVARMVAVFREVRRVLREDGTLWLNIGDSYAAGGKGGGGSYMLERADAAWQGRSQANGWRPPPAGMKPKDLVGIPWMLAFALRADGWYLRSDIIWAKPNPMPESVTDRPTKAHEYVFLLSKSERYFYDAEAIQEDTAQPWRVGTIERSFSTGDSASTLRRDAGRAVERTAHRNRRTVWTIPTQPYKGAHFATYPERLVEPCIKAGSSERGCCPACRTPWERVVESQRVPTRPGVNTKCLAKSDGDAQTADTKGWNRPQVIGNRDPQRHVREARTVGWQPTCDCPPADPVPCVVLDPFTGSGTTGAVAVGLRRSFVGCELNPAYIELARERIGSVAPLLASEVA